jgi:hypothetical protein
MAGRGDGHKRGFLDDSRIGVNISGFPASREDRRDVRQPQLWRRRWQARRRRISVSLSSESSASRSIHTLNQLKIPPSNSPRDAKSLAVSSSARNEDVSITETLDRNSLMTAHQFSLSMSAMGEAAPDAQHGAPSLGFPRSRGSSWHRAAKERCASRLIWHGCRAGSTTVKAKALAPEKRAEIARKGSSLAFWSSISFRVSSVIVITAAPQTSARSN